MKINDQYDGVIHLAAVIPPLADEQPSLAKAVNTNGTINLINQLETVSPNAFFMYSSSISVYGDRIASPNIKVSDPLQVSLGDEYAVTKIDAEKVMKIDAKRVENEGKMEAKINDFSCFFEKGENARNHCIYKLKRGSGHVKSDEKSM